MFDIKVRNKIAGTHQFEPISVSDNHSLVVFDKKLKQTVKITPIDLKENFNNYIEVNFDETPEKAEYFNNNSIDYVCPDLMF